MNVKKKGVVGNYTFARLLSTCCFGPLSNISAVFKILKHKN